MERRDFIRGTAAVALPLTLNGYNVHAMGLSPMMETLGSIAAATDRVLVLVRLSGGNDGLNTVIALDQYDVYNRVRANVTIPAERTLKLTPATALHPAMTGMKALYDQGKLAIIQGVTYPTPNQSHFRSTDILMSGSAYNQYLTTGWAARMLDGQFPNFPTAYPSKEMPDPLAIEVGQVPSLIFREDAAPVAVNITTNANAPLTLVAGAKGIGTEPLPDTPAGKQIAYIRQVQGSSAQYATVIKAAVDKAKNRATYPTAGQNSLADQLAIVARLIGGGLKTRVYMVTLGGFDTHATQVATDRTTGSHATLLSRLSDAIRIFQDDIKMMGVEDKVIGMTFSEFGRRVNSNIASGTDHGTAAPQFVFGSQVKGGLIGTNPNLSDLTNSNLKMQYDFRDMYASILKQWFETSSKEYANVFSREFTQIPLVKGASTTTDITNAYTFANAGGIEIALRSYPNPCTVYATIEYSIPSASRVQMSIHDMQGRHIASVPETYQTAGTYTMNLDVANYPAGSYMYSLHTEQGSKSRQFVVTR